MRSGIFVAIDYGYTRQEQLAGRHRSTLMAYRQHSATPDPYEAPGEQDITAHVNFTALAAAIKEHGMDVHPLLTQSQFLMGVGELVMLSQVVGLLEGGGRRATAIDPQLKAKVESLVYLRQEARRQRDFAEADQLREELTRLGVVLEDARDGTTWKLQS